MSFIWTYLFLCLHNSALSLTTNEMPENQSDQQITKLSVTQPVHPNLEKDTSQSTIFMDLRNNQTFIIQIAGCYDWENLTANNLTFLKIKIDAITTTDCVCKCGILDGKIIHYFVKDQTCYCLTNETLSMEAEFALKDCNLHNQGQRFPKESNSTALLYKRVYISTGIKNESGKNIPLEKKSLNSNCEKRLLYQCKAVNALPCAEPIRYLDNVNSSSLQTYCEYTALFVCANEDLIGTENSSLHKTIAGFVLSTTTVVAIVVAVEFIITVLLCFVRKRLWKKHRKRKRNTEHTVINQDNTIVRNSHISISVSENHIQGEWYLFSNEKGNHINEADGSLKSIDRCSNAEKRETPNLAEASTGNNIRKRSDSFSNENVDDVSEGDDPTYSSDNSKVSENHNTPQPCKRQKSEINDMNILETSFSTDPNSKNTNLVSKYTVSHNVNRSKDLVTNILTPCDVPPQLKECSRHSCVGHVKNMSQKDLSKPEARSYINE